MNALASSRTLSSAFSFPLEHIDLRLEEGYNVTYPCNDVVDSNMQINRTYRPVSGTAVLTVNPVFQGQEIWERSGLGSVRLENVVFESDGESVAVEYFEILDQPIGWLPG